MSDDIKKPRGKRVRSPYLFPAYDFNLARQIAEMVEKDGAGRLSEETLAINLGLSAKASGFQLKTLTARQFGLLTKQGNILSTTPLAKSIFKPASEEEMQRAMVQSFLSLPLFREVANRFRGQPLPQGKILRNVLEQEFKIDSKRVSDAERVLMDSARDTGVLVSTGGNEYLSTEKATFVKKEEEFNNDRQFPTASSAPDIYSKILPTSPGMILTISEEDFVSFDDQEFDIIWGAMGKIVRARCKRQQLTQDLAVDEDSGW